MISLKFVPKGLINIIPALVQILAWRRSGDKPLSEPMLVGLLTHICLTRPQVWSGMRLLFVKWNHDNQPRGASFGKPVLCISHHSILPLENISHVIPARYCQLGEWHSVLNNPDCYLLRCSVRLAALHAYCLLAWFISRTEVNNQLDCFMNSLWNLEMWFSMTQQKIIKVKNIIRSQWF